MQAIAGKNRYGALRQAGRQLVLWTSSGLLSMACASEAADGGGLGPRGPGTPGVVGAAPDRDHGDDTETSPGADVAQPGLPDPGNPPPPAEVPDPIVDVRCRADAMLPQRIDYAQRGPYAVATAEFVFDDTSRPIAASDTHAAAPSRRLATTVHYPAATPPPLFGPAPVASGPFPLLMYSHGFSSGRNEAVPIASHAASHGYIVVAPDFPLTNLTANGNRPDVTDAANQPGDVSFLLDRVLELAADSSHFLARAVDESRIGALGVSLGGLTTLLVSYHPRFRDERIQVAAPIAALSAFFAPGFYRTRKLPLLLIHGDQDAFIDYERNARRSFERASPNARLITVAQGSHAAFGVQLDAATLALIGPFIAAPESDPSNPDGLGCGAVGGTLSTTGPSFLDALGGPEDFIEPDDTELRPCQGDEYKRPAIDAREQQDMAVRAVVAFFDAHLGKTPETRTDGCRYLLHELVKTPAVTLE
jgi:dienelactone hydrolase